jgi:hypothetical protein
MERQHNEAESDRVLRDEAFHTDSPGGRRTSSPRARDPLDERFPAGSARGRYDSITAEAVMFQRRRGSMAWGVMITV